MIHFNVVHLNTRRLQGIKQQDNPLDFGTEPGNLLSEAVFLCRASTCPFQEQPAKGADWTVTLTFLAPQVLKSSGKAQNIIRMFRAVTELFNFISLLFFLILLPDHTIHFSVFMSVRQPMCLSWNLSSSNSKVPLCQLKIPTPYTPSSSECQSSSCQSKPH